MKVVMVFGAFDGLHPGHLDFFRQAKKFGDSLVVSVGTDKNVEKIKERKPLFNQDERLDMVRECRIVDNAIIGSEGDFYHHIKIYRPDVVCLGYDQWAKEKDVRLGLDKVGLTKTKIVRLKPYRVERAKSTITKNLSVDFGDLRNSSE